MTKRTPTPSGLTRTLEISASSERVFDAITTDRGLQGWWVSRAHRTASEGTIRLEFDGVDEHIDMRVDVADRPSHIQWTCLEHSALREWRGTTIDFRLVRRSSTECRLEFRHIGLVPALECFEDCQLGWDHFLKSLVLYVEAAKGTPFTAS